MSTKSISGKTLRLKHAASEAEEYVEITVSDTGIGMDDITRQRIFEPFFTTKGFGKGTGLGLSMVFGIVESHKGFIEVESSLGQGSTFRIYLPVQEYIQDPDLSEQLISTTAEDVTRGTETILLIEDEEMLRELLKGILVMSGYTVLTAEDGEQGVDTYVEHQKEISLVISDVGLPKIGGDEVFKKIHSINPKVKVILASGYIEPETKSMLLNIGVKQFIQKPYSPNEVLQIVRKVIDSNS